MHVAVDLGAKPGESFVSYLDDLEAKGYVTPPMKPWVGLIRTNANRAGHDVDPVPAIRAESTATFTGELLRLTYEMKHLAGRFANPAEIAVAIEDA